MRLYIFFLLIVNVYSLTEVIIILGCSNNSIQKERVQAGLNYIRKSKLPKILYLSGGIKNDIQDSISESSKMLKEIKNHKIDATVVIDEKSKNTAENFVNLKKWIQSNYVYNLFNFVIVTSDFHKDRALKLFSAIFDNVKAKFILSKSDCIQCWKDEKIHSKNIKSDIMDALIFVN